MSHPEIERIRNDLRRARQRVAEIESGTRGQRTGPWQEVEGNAGAGLAMSNQLLAQRAAVGRLELEYVQAMIPRWGADRIIAAMEPHG